MGPTTEVERCELSELPVDSCGCRQHRGGRTPQEQYDAERAQWSGRVFLARHPGHCEVCDEPIRPGQQIVALVGSYGRGHYRHADCEEE